MPGDPPAIVAEFAGKLKAVNEQYVFAIATWGHNPGGTLGLLKKMLRENGSGLNAGFAVKGDFEPESECMGLTKLMKIFCGLKTLTIKERLPGIIEVLKNKKNHKPEMSSFITCVLGNLFHGIAVKNYKTGDNNFRLDKNCNFCGICAKVCPRENLMVKNGRIYIKHNCEGCYACYHWCPRRSIHLESNIYKLKAGYHHPEINLDDVILR